MRTVGVDLAAQPARTGLVELDWSGDPPRVSRSTWKVGDRELLDACEEAARDGGRVGIDCPLGWPDEFVAFVAAHADARPLPTCGPDTQALRLRATDVAVRDRLGRYPLSVSTSLLGVTALRAARLLAALNRRGLRVDRTGCGPVCEVYPAASRAVWGLSRRGQDLDEVLERIALDVGPADRRHLENRDAFDALLAALTSRAVAVGATDPCPAEQADRASREGWIHVPVPGHRLADLAGG